MNSKCYNCTHHNSNTIGCLLETECDRDKGALYSPIIIESHSEQMIAKMNDDKCNSCGWFYLQCHNPHETICQEENLYQWSPINQVSIYEKEQINNDYIYKEAVLSFSNDPATRFHYSEKNIHIESFELGVKSKSAEKYVINKYANVLQTVLNNHQWQDKQDHFITIYEPQWSSEMSLQDWINDMEKNGWVDHIFYSLCKIKMLLD